MAGPEIQANAIWTALHGNPLRDAPRCGWAARDRAARRAWRSRCSRARARLVLAVAGALVLAAVYALIAQFAFGRRARPRR